MDFDLDDQHVALQSSIGKFLAATGEPALERVIRDGYAFDASSWQRLAEQIGLPGLLVSEEAGGSGAGTVEMVLALEELGKACYPSPMVSTAIATATLARLADAAADLLGDVAAGSSVVTFAISDTSGDWLRTDYAVRADAAGDQWTLTGAKVLVRDGGTASHLLVTATTDDGPGIFLCPVDQSGVQVAIEQGFDPGTELARVELDAATATSLAVGAEAADLLALAAADAALFQAAECLGLGAGALARSVDWAGQREQFGRAIGTNQALKHLCADTLMEVEAARVLVYYAATLAPEGTGGSPVDEYRTATSHAKAQAASAARIATANLIQILGGIGFTWEHPAHLYFKRARLDGILAGSTTEHLDRIADAVLAVKG